MDRTTMSIYKSRCNELRNEGLALSELNDYENFKNVLDLETFKKCIREKVNRSKKRHRTREKYIELLEIRNALRIETNTVFGTLTLDNKHLKQKEDTYIRKIAKWLKSHFIYAILNKDFGSKTEREHYHFIGLTSEDLIEIQKDGKTVKSRKGIPLHNLTKQDYELGFEPALEIINFDSENIDTTINYLLKLNNHSNKVGTKSRIRIYKNELAKMTAFMNITDIKKENEKWNSKIRKMDIDTYIQTVVKTRTKKSNI